MGHGKVATLAGILLLVGCGAPLEGDEDGERFASTCGANVSPAAPTFTSGIDSYASYDGQTTCDPTEKPGVVAFMNLVLATYPCTSSSGITRSCSTGGTSEHKEGRAWDWGLSYPHPAADSFLAWLLATDEHGNEHAMARRLGIMYMIWNNKIWKSYKASAGWQPYTGSNPHTDHVHFSFSWDGANKKTSFWTSGTTPAPTPTPPSPPAPQDPPPPPPPTTNQAPLGWLQTADCGGITGWAQDPDGANATVDVRIRIDQGAPIVIRANESRPELCTQLGSCQHGYRLILPVQYRDGKQHTVQAEALDLGTGPAALLKGNPKTFTCNGSTPSTSPDNPSDPDPDPVVPGQGPTQGGGMTPGVGAAEPLTGGCSVSATPVNGAWSALALLLLIVLCRKQG